MSNAGGFDAARIVDEIERDGVNDGTKDALALARAMLVSPEQDVTVGGELLGPAKDCDFGYDTNDGSPYYDITGPLCDLAMVLDGDTSWRVGP